MLQPSSYSSKRLFEQVHVRKILSTRIQAIEIEIDFEMTYRNTHLVVQDKDISISLQTCNLSTELEEQISSIAE